MNKKKTKLLLSWWWRWMEAINERMDMADCFILGQDYNNSAMENVTGIEIFHNVV